MVPVPVPRIYIKDETEGVALDTGKLLHNRRLSVMQIAAQTGRCTHLPSPRYTLSSCHMCGDWCHSKVSVTFKSMIVIPDAQYDCFIAQLPEPCTRFTAKMSMGAEVQNASF